MPKRIGETDNVILAHYDSLTNRGIFEFCNLAKKGSKIYTFEEMKGGSIYSLPN